VRDKIKSPREKKHEEILTESDVDVIETFVPDTTLNIIDSIDLPVSLSNKTLANFFYEEDKGKTKSVKSNQPLSPRLLKRSKESKKDKESPSKQNDYYYKIQSLQSSPALTFDDYF